MKGPYQPSTYPDYLPTYLPTRLPRTLHTPGPARPIQHAQSPGHCIVLIVPFVRWGGPERLCPETTNPTYLLYNHPKIALRTLTGQPGRCLLFLPSYPASQLAGHPNNN